MKALIVVLIAFALLIGASMLATERFHDRELFVPPPDAVAEGFVREVICGRYAQAREYLEEPIDDNDLRELDESLGDPWRIDAKLVSRDDQRAEVTVGSLTFELAFDEDWKITSIGTR